MKVLKAPDVFGHKKIEIAYSLETKLNKFNYFSFILKSTENCRFLDDLKWERSN